MDVVIEEEEMEVESEFLVRLLTSAKEIRERDEQSQGTGDNTSSDAAALASLQEQYAALQLSFQTLTKKLEKITKLSNKVNTHQLSNVLLPQSVTPLNPQPPKVTIRREFKINGQIGERGQKDKL